MLLELKKIGTSAYLMINRYFKARRDHKKATLLKTAILSGGIKRVK